MFYVLKTIGCLMLLSTLASEIFAYGILLNYVFNLTLSVARYRTGAFRKTAFALVKTRI